MLGRRVLKGDGAAVLKSEVVPKNSGAAVEVKQGQRLRIAGKSLFDFMAFNPESSAFVTIGVRT
jgi:uncharacterized protein YcgI (DUF1989 family)